MLVFLFLLAIDQVFRLSDWLLSDMLVLAVGSSQYCVSRYQQPFIQKYRQYLDIREDLRLWREPTWTFPLRFFLILAGSTRSVHDERTLRNAISSRVVILHFFVMFDSGRECKFLRQIYLLNRTVSSFKRDLILTVLRVHCSIPFMKVLQSWIHFLLFPSFCALVVRRHSFFIPLPFVVLELDIRRCSDHWILWGIVV